MPCSLTSLVLEKTSFRPVAVDFEFLSSRPEAASDAPLFSPDAHLYIQTFLDLELLWSRPVFSSFCGWLTRPELVAFWGGNLPLYLPLIWNVS